MRSYFTNEDIKNLIEDVYKDNTIEVDLKDEETGEKTPVDMVEHLGIKFYSWWNHEQSAVEALINNGGDIQEAWKDSITDSIGKGAALIEQLDEETILSQDIEGGTLLGRITFLVDANKITELEYYLRYLKNLYIGNPITRETSNGMQVVGYLTLGILLYDQEPQTTQFGESIVATINFKWNYLKLAGTYSDIKLSLSLTGLNGAYKEMPMIKYTWQNIFTKESVPIANKVDDTGVIIKAISRVVTISYYDFENDLINALNEQFWDIGAYSIDGVVQGIKDVNIPVWLKVQKGNKTRIYKCVIADMQKVLANNEFTISSITLNGWGKVGA